MYYGNEKIAAELEINYYDIRKLHNNMIIIYIYSSKTSLSQIHTHTHILSFSLLSPSPFTGFSSNKLFWPFRILAFFVRCFIYVNIHRKLGNPLIFQLPRPLAGVE